MKALRSEYLQILSIIAKAKEIPPISIRAELLKQGVEMRRQYLHARLQVLLNKHYIQKRHQAGVTYYSITLLGTQEFALAISHQKRNLLHTNTQSRMKHHLVAKSMSKADGIVAYKAKRLEAYRFDYPLVHHLHDDREDKVMLVRATGLSFSINTGMKNHETITIHYDIEARISTNYLSLHIPAQAFPTGTLSKEKEAELRKQADGYALKLEHRLNQARFKLFNAQRRRGIYQNFELSRFEGELICEIGDSEIAEEAHKIAEAMKAKGLRQLKVMHPKTGKLRMKPLDFSKGPESEFFHATEEGVAQDSDTWDAQINAVLDKQVNLLDINRLKKLVKREAEEISELKTMYYLQQDIRNTQIMPDTKKNRLMN